jgi:hypothetical protein
MNEYLMQLPFVFEEAKPRSSSLSTACIDRSTQQLEFDFSFNCPFIEAQYYREGAQDLIQKIVPADLLEPSPYEAARQRARFAEMTPQVYWSELSRAPCSLSVLLLCKFRQNACQFFYDMISRWLLPTRKINVELFFASDVRLPHLSDELLSVAEIVIYIKSLQEMEEVRRNLHAIETEIRLGVVSNYHARRIVEFKGLSTDGKTAMIQEKIGSLMQSHSKDFDRGIFSQMQHFLVTCREDFKKIRDYHHISRIISNLHSVQKVLQQQTSELPQKRHVMVKFLKTRLHLYPAPLETLHFDCAKTARIDDRKLGHISNIDQFTIVDSSEFSRGSKSKFQAARGIDPKGKTDKPVLGVLVGLNFLREHELCNQHHLLTAIQKLASHVRMVDGSVILEKDKEGCLQLIYLEIEKENGEDFSFDEVQALRTSLPGGVMDHIEQLTHPIFMPRNEEEILRNIMALARQIRYVNDRSQVIISFDEQKGDDLCFTVILLRVRGEHTRSIQDLFAADKTEICFLPERIRRLGSMRRKYAKEAALIRAAISMKDFMRLDRSIDLYKARQAIFTEVERLVGEVRDFNGGMILKQQELLDHLKKTLGRAAEQHSLLLEQFFFALTPMEMRSVLEPDSLKQWFLMLLQATKVDLKSKRRDGDWLCKQDNGRIFALFPDLKSSQVPILQQRLSSLGLAQHALISFSLVFQEIPYLGYLLFSENRELQEKVLEILEEPLPV